jgi:hypothetical protein
MQANMKVFFCLADVHRKLALWLPIITDSGHTQRWLIARQPNLQPNAVV